MKRIMSNIILFVIFISMLTPSTIGIITQNVQKSDCNVIMINMMLWKLTRDGYFIYNVTNVGNQTIENQTIKIHIQGGAVFHGTVDVETSIFIEHLLPTHSELYKTKDQIFTRKQYPIFNRPLIGTVIEEETFMNCTQRGIIHIMFAFLREEVDHYAAYSVNYHATVK